jgi:beta-xylosidase
MAGVPAPPVYDGYFADPFVLRVDDAYYAYGTGSVVDGRAFEILRSTDLRRWERVGGAVPLLADDDATDYWAPEVMADGGAFHLYYSVGRGDSGHRIRVASADAPAGPFVDAGVVLTPDERFAIDPSPFRDDDGERYLYFARDVLDGDRVGTALAVDRLVSPTRLAGEPRTVLRATADWQLFRRARPIYGGVYDWHTLEGPFVVKRAGRYYCFYSGGNWAEPGYAVSYAVADSPLGPFVEPPGDAATVLRGDPDIVGPGHNSVVTDARGVDHIVFHAWDAARTKRQMRVARLSWTADGPRVDGLSA